MSTTQPPTRGYVPSSTIDRGTGLCKYYDIPGKKWKTGQPIDVREMVEQGTANFVGPNVELKGPAGQIVVPANQVQAKLAEGYSYVTDEDRAKAEASKEAEDDDELGPDEEVYDFTKHSVAELRALAEEAGIENPSRMTKAQLVEALDESGFDPEAGEEEDEDEDEEDED